MKKQLILLCSIALLGLTVIGYGDDNEANSSESCASCASVSDNDLFVLITEDKSDTLTVNSNNYHHYYYLRDTGIVYVGLIAPNTVKSDSEFISPAISEHGNYYHYDAEKLRVVEVD